VRPHPNSFLTTSSKSTNNLLVPIVPRRGCSHDYSGHHVVHPYPAFLEIRAAPDYGIAQTGAGAHGPFLPNSFYDAHKTGALVSRIMSEVEGVRNLVGTGLVELAGGMLTALIAPGHHGED